MMEVGCRWNYINEGNVHIVIQLLETNHALRLIKVDQEPVKSIDVHKSAKFVNLVMVPLLFNQCNLYQEVIELSDSLLSELREVLRGVRPEKRRVKSELSKFAIKTENLSILSSLCDTNYCIEIKPKEGFLSSGLKSLSRCYYCLKQHLKQESHQIRKRSNYCPLDLFSGDRKRMKSALISMIDNPQNNFKIFKEGKIIYDDSSDIFNFEKVVKSMDIFSNNNMFLDFIIHVLLSEQILNLKETEEVIDLRPNSECLNITNLHRHSFLYNILQVQLLGDGIDIDIKDLSGNPKDYVSNVLDLLQRERLNLYDSDDREKFLNNAEIIHLAMISAVAKDCSIMISFSPNYVSDTAFISIGNKKICFRVFATDLEAKNVDSLIKRKTTERKMITVYKNYMDRKINKKDCKIQPNTETRAKQLEAWGQLIMEYFKTNKLSILDIREAQNSPLFNNASINRKLPQEGLVTILEDMAKTGRASPMDKSKMVWEVYWHSLDEWGNMIYSWASNNGMNNTVCTLFELREGETTEQEEFHGLDMNILTKALKSLEAKGKCELMEFDDNQGVKFF